MNFNPVKVGVMAYTTFFEILSAHCGPLLVIVKTVGEV